MCLFHPFVTPGVLVLAAVVMSGGPAAGQPIAPADALAAVVPPGFRVEVAIRGLTYPTSIEMDADGVVYIAEAGPVGPDREAKPRVLRIRGDEAPVVYASEGLSAPVNDLLFHEGKLYVSHGGKVSIIGKAGDERDLVSGLPSRGDHHNNQLAAGPDGRIYIGQGTVTNSGVVGVDAFLMGWLDKNPDLHDVPAKNIKLRESVFETPARPDGTGAARTSAFAPFGKTFGAREVPGVVKANGTILSLDASGGDLQVFAWGFRNPFGLAFAPDGRLLASENGFDERGSRRIANATDDLYEVEKGAFYGWPDYSAGIPVTDPRFRPADGPAPEFLLAERPRVQMPAMTFPIHAGVAKLVFIPEGAFGPGGDLFLAVFGPMTPITGAHSPTRGTFEVTRIDLAERQVTSFLTGRALPAPAAAGVPPAAEDRPTPVRAAGRDQAPTAWAGPRRPIDLIYARDSLWVVDFGPMEIKADGHRAFPGSGVVWKISRVAKSGKGR